MKKQKNDYWVDRIVRAQTALSDKNTAQVERQLRKYYRRTFDSCLVAFEQTYQHILDSIEDGREPTPADLFKLDRYWMMQRQIRRELYTLGDLEIDLLSRRFERNFFDVYNSFSISGRNTYSTISKEAARQMINSVWCADGKTWSERVWGNVAYLQETLNEGLIDCVVNGRKTTDLKKILQERFDVSYSRADMLVRTEMAHIQTQAAKQRYEDYGLEEYEILGNEDDTCHHKGVDCHKMDGKRFRYDEMREGVNAPPFHPNCKCCIVPVVDI